MTLAAIGVPAEWPARAGAFGIDVLAGLGLAACLVLIGLSAPDGGWVWWACLLLAVLVLLAVAVNRWLLPAVRGWSLGRSVFGIRVVDRSGDAVGPFWLLARDAAHLLDTAPLLLGWLWPLIDSRGRTFADLLARTEVWTVEQPAAEPRRRAAVVLSALTTAATVVAALGFFLIFQQQRGVAHTRSQIQNIGPALVTDMLSYTAANVDKDFEHDRTLVTDGYRDELVKQQDAVRKTAVDNEYWVTNKAVLEASPDTATMLMLLQGQRGQAPKTRFITASVRASFEKVGAEWKISGLTVLAPQQPENPPPPAKPEPAKPAPPKPNGPGR